MKKFQKVMDKITGLPVLKRRWLYILGIVIFTLLFLATMTLAVVAPFLLRMMGSQMEGFLAVRVLMIVFAALDALCIFMLIYIRRKKKRLERDEMKERWEQAAESGESHVVRPEEDKEKHPYRIWIILAIIVVALIVLVEVLTHRDRSSASQTATTLHSGVAELTDLSTVLPGSGTLTEDDAEDYTLPEGVQIKRWYVSNGDTVQEGDLLGMVDQVSAMTTIVEVQEKLDLLDEALADCEDQAATDTITAPAAGRVIKIYATQNAAVADVMYSDSALMLLSLDGLMAVSIDTDVSLTAGDAVNVTTSDGTQMEGRVDSMTHQTAVITVSDEGTTPGDTVTVKTTGGQTVGEGKLYIHSEWKVTGFVGNVSSISVTEGSTVSKGETLMTLTDTEDTGAFDLLLEQRRKLESQMEALFKVYTDGYLYAPCDGVISNLDTSTAAPASKENSATTASAVHYTIENVSYAAGAPVSAASLATSGSEGQIVRLSEVSTLDYEDDLDQLNTLMQDLEKQMKELQELVDAAGDQSLSDKMTELNKTLEDIENVAKKLSDESPNVEELEKEIADLTDRVNALTEENEELRKQLEEGGTGGTTTDYAVATVGSVSGSTVTVSYVSGSGPASVTLSGSISLYDGSYHSGASASQISAGDTLIMINISGSSVGSAICVKAGSSGGTQGEGSYDEGYADGFAAGVESAAEGLGDLSGLVGETGGQGGSGIDVESMLGESGINLDDYDLSADELAGLYGDIDDLAGLYGDIEDLTGLYDDYDFSDLGDLDMSALEGVEEANRLTEALEADVEEAYGIEDKTILTVTPQDTMTITITVDEMDILQLEKGQTARVTLDAFPGQSFEGTVTGIHRSGTNSGGSTKYTADILLDREEGMLAGMNASAQITLDVAEDVLCIPEAALIEEDGATYVYTSYNANTDELGGLVEVTTGLSDGTNVQILSGLEEGDEYFYKYLDVVNYESASSVSEGGFF